MVTKKNLSIETLRGIAILLVVMGHVVGSAPSGGMKIDFPHPLRFLYLWIDFIQMPLFTAIAGWVYALKPFSAESGFYLFVRKKALRLLLPMISVGTLYFLIQYFIPGTNNKGELSQIWRIFIFPYTIYWYLPSLFLIFVGQWWIDRWKIMNSKTNWWICIGVGIVLSLTNDVGFMHSLPNLFSFKGALGQLPYFFVGVGLNRFISSSHLFFKRKSVGFILFLCLTCLIYGIWVGTTEEIAMLRLCYPLFLIPILFYLLSMSWRNSFFAWLGKYAYSIYLFHGFGTAGGRILLKAFGLKAIYLIFLCSTLIATLCPIMLDRMMKHFRLGRRIILGE